MLSLLGTPLAPQVNIEGFPFLTQILGQKLTSVHVVADDVTETGTAGVSLANVDVRLRGLTSPDRFRTFNAERADGSATLDYATAEKLVHLPLSYAGENRLKISVQTKLVAIPVTAEIVGRPDVNEADQTFTLADPKITMAGVDVPEATSESLLQTLVKPMPITGVPFGLSVSDITAQPDGLNAVVLGDDITFSR
ncbi:MAG: DUF2993 domain-containing protein [Propionibacteriaceae bacterium]